MKIIFTLSTIALLAMCGGAEVSALSEASPLDTCSLSSFTTQDVQDLETRSYSMNWSEGCALTTKAVVGTFIIIR